MNIIRTNAMYDGLELVLIDGDGYWMDENGNYWNATTTTGKQAVEYSKSLVNCKGCKDCKGCTSCVYCNECRACIDCVNCNYTNRCIHCFCCDDCCRSIDCENQNRIMDTMNQK